MAAAVGVTGPFLFPKWPHLNKSPSRLLGAPVCVTGLLRTGAQAQLVRTVRDQALTLARPGTTHCSFCSFSGEPPPWLLRTRASCSPAPFPRILPPPPSGRPQDDRPLVERAANGRACYSPASGVGAALEAWQRSAASGVGTMSSIGTGVSLFRAVLSGSALPGVRGAGPLDPGRCRSPGDPRPGPSAP